jgi:hypothetical protein
MAVVICVLWARPVPFNLRAASLCIGSVIVSPYVLFYDLCILSFAVAFLVKEGLSRGFLPGERTVILLCWPALFFVKAPIGAVVSSVLAFLCSRRVMNESAIMVSGRYRANSENAGLVVGEQAPQSQIGHPGQPPSAR